MEEALEKLRTQMDEAVARRTSDTSFVLGHSESFYVFNVFKILKLSNFNVFNVFNVHPIILVVFHVLFCLSEDV